MSENREPSDAEIALAAKRYETIKWAIPAAWIVALWVPITAMQPIARAFAGRSTNITIAISVTFALTVAVSGALIAMFRKMRDQKGELIRTRERADALEHELELLKKQDARRLPAEIPQGTSEVK